MNESVGNNNVAVIIPARYKSSRFPGKPLVSLNGVPMIIRVARRCAEAVGNNNVYVATDSAEIANVVSDHGFHFIMTGEDALTGTDRIAEASRQLNSDIIVNVQGDEPLVNPEDINKVIAAKIDHPHDVINAYCTVGKDEDPTSTNLPKVVFNESCQMLYMSRAPIPGRKTVSPDATYYKQVCIYAYDKEQLDKFSGMGRKSNLELEEDIEILRFLDLGVAVKMVEASPGSLAVDVPSDVAPVEKRIHEVEAGTG